VATLIVVFLFLHNLLRLKKAGRKVLVSKIKQF